MTRSVLRLDMRAPAFSPAKPGELYAAALEMASYVDENGFDTISVSEHHGIDDGFLSSPIAMAGVLLGRTRRVRVTVSALLATLYEPLRLAEDVAVLDLASGGRFSLTAGMGYRPEEYEMLGRDFAARGKLLDHVVATLLQAWSGEPFEYEGRTVRVTPKLGSPHPPILIGGQSKAAARRAARFGLPYQPANNDAEQAALYHAECEKHGAMPMLLPPGDGSMTWVSDDPEKSWAEIGEYLLHDARSYASWQPPSQRSAMHSHALDSVDALRAEGLYAILTPAECIALAKQRGPDGGVVLFPLCGGTPPELAWPSVRLYVEQVLPALRD